MLMITGICSGNATSSNVVSKLVVNKDANFSLKRVGEDQTVNEALRLASKIARLRGKLCQAEKDCLARAVKFWKDKDIYIETLVNLNRPECPKTIHYKKKQDDYFLYCSLLLDEILKLRNDLCYWGDRAGSLAAAELQQMIIDNGLDKRRGLDEEFIAEDEETQYYLLLGGTFDNNGNKKDVEKATAARMSLETHTTYCLDGVSQDEVNVLNQFIRICEDEKKCKRWIDMLDKMMDRAETELKRRIEEYRMSWKDRLEKLQSKLRSIVEKNGLC